MYKPESGALEKLFFQNNTTTAMKVANAIGVIILVLKMHEIKYNEYTPTQVKQAITGVITSYSIHYTKLYDSKIQYSRSAGKRFWRKRIF